MNIQQRKLVFNILTVTVFTTVMIVGFGNLKNAINRSEAIRAMNILSKNIFSLREKAGSLPTENIVMEIIEQEGMVRISNLQYRAMWIDYGSDPNSTILAYAQKNYRGFVKSGYAVLWLSGKVEWIKKEAFEKIITEQQKKRELQWLKDHLQKTEY